MFRPRFSSDFQIVTLYLLRAISLLTAPWKMCYPEAYGETRWCTLKVAEMEGETFRGRHAVQRGVRPILVSHVQGAVRRRTHQI